MRGEFIVHHFLFRKINDTANTPHKKCFMSRKHFRDPDGFNRNQVKVPSRSAPVALVLLLALQHHQMNEDWHWFLFKNWYIWYWKFIRVVSRIWRKNKIVWSNNDWVVLLTAPEYWKKTEILDENYLWWDNEELLREERSREEWPGPGRLPWPADCLRVQRINYGSVNYDVERPHYL